MYISSLQDVNINEFSGNYEVFPKESVIVIQAQGREGAKREGCNYTAVEYCIVKHELHINPMGPAYYGEYLARLSKGTTHVKFDKLFIKEEMARPVKGSYKME